MLFRILISVLVCLSISGYFVAEAKSNSKDKCLKTREKIEKVQSKMRQGYTSKQGENYRKKLKKLYKEEFKHCF